MLADNPDRLAGRVRRRPVGQHSARKRLTASVRLFAVLLVAASAWGWSADAADYVGSETCIGCHAEAGSAWEGSHHALAWTPPAPDTVVADFDGAEFSLDGMTARFRIAEDGTYHVAVTEKDGEAADYPVHSVAGIEPLQQYILETEPGRLQSFDVVWDTEAKRWFHLYPEQSLPPDDAMHWTGPYKNWNGRCAACHATGYDKNYDHATRSYASTQAEIGVGCEACHGAGSDHVAWTGSGESGGEPLPASGFSLDIDDPVAVMTQCATCHSRREAHLPGSPPPGTPYDDAYNLALFRPGLYHADGQIQDEVYVWGSFLQSKMHGRGVTCANCHEPHAADLVADGNAVCGQCHSPAGNEAFPTLTPALYDDPSHHHHETGSAGAQCKSCHMIERTYMGVDGRRDHSFRVPRPDLAAETGAPDACTDCHAGRSPGWAAERIAEWYPKSDHRGPHYGSVLARARQDPVAAAGDLERLARDRDRPGIVRATALWLLRQSESPEAAARLADLVDDDDPLVRSSAVGLQGATRTQDSVLSLVDALDDPARNVRMSAAVALANAPVARFPPRIADDLRLALGEWQASMTGRLDFPETHLQLAGWALTARNFPAAAAGFRETVEMDPQRVDAWVMLARIAAATEGEAAARAVLEEALQSNSDDLTLLDLRAELDGQPIDGRDLLPPAE